MNNSSTARVSCARLRKYGIFIRAARAGVLKHAVQRIGQRGDRAQIGDLRADRVQQDRRRRGLPDLRAQIGERGGSGQPAFQLVFRWDGQSVIVCSSSEKM